MRSAALFAGVIACAPAAVAEPVSASAYNLALEPYALVVDAGEERGVFRAQGLEVRWVTRDKRAVNVTDLPELLKDGTELGLSSPGEIFAARASGIRIKAVAGFIGDSLVRIYARGHGPIRQPRDFDGKRIGPTSLAVQRQVGYFSRAYGIKAEAAPFSTLDSAVASLRDGKVDGIITAEARVLALVDRGELRLIARAPDYRPRPELNNAVWASDALIEQRPDLVRTFVRATLETVRYLKENPADAARLVAKRTGMPDALARKAVEEIDWVPGGAPGGDLPKAALNYWEVLKGTGALPPEAALKIEELVDTRFVQ